MDSDDGVEVMLLDYLESGTGVLVLWVVQCWSEWSLSYQVR